MVALNSLHIIPQRLFSYRFLWRDVRDFLQLLCEVSWSSCLKPNPWSVDRVVSHMWHNAPLLIWVFSYSKSTQEGFVLLCLLFGKNQRKLKWENESISKSRADEEDAHDKRRLHKVLSVRVQTVSSWEAVSWATGCALTLAVSPSCSSADRAATPSAWPSGHAPLTARHMFQGIGNLYLLSLHKCLSLLL